MHSVYENKCYLLQKETDSEHIVNIRNFFSCCRNDVWRYTKENYGGQWRNAAISLGRGLKWAVAAMAVTIAVDKFISKEADHGQGDHGDH